MGTISIDVTSAPVIPPTVNAGADQSINAPANTASLRAIVTAPNSTIVNIMWVQTYGSGATIVSPGSLNTNLTGLSSGTNTFTITVTDNYGNVATSSVTINVIASQPLAYKWIPDFRDTNYYSCVSGIVTIYVLCKVTNDSNYYPLDAYNNLCSQSGNTQAQTYNHDGDSYYIAPYTDPEQCPAN